MSSTRELPGDLSELLKREQATISKLQVLFGHWWPYYAPPYLLRWTLFTERKHCPYCGGTLGSPEGDEAGNLDYAHLDHMDPLSRGGDESVRNAVYVCAACNIAKGKRLFVEWLQRLPDANQAAARAVYLEKHEHAPEEFVPGPRQPRLLLNRPELDLDEGVLRRLFPKPIVSGPPRRTVS